MYNRGNKSSGVTYMRQRLFTDKILEQKQLHSDEILCNLVGVAKIKILQVRKKSKTRVIYF